MNDNDALMLFFPSCLAKTLLSAMQKDVFSMINGGELVK